MKYCPACKQDYPDTNQQHCPNDGHLLSLPDPYHLVGQTLLEKYRIDALAGIGGMGAVYSAHHLIINRRVAFKILLPNLALGNPQMAGFFQREAELAGQLHHENIVDITDAGRTPDGIVYIVMEWLDGRTLDEEILEKQRLSLDRTAMILRQIAAALDHAHTRNIIHRDLKPANIMIVKRPEGGEVVKVVDFGIAKAVSEATAAPVSSVILTPHYASPEQYVLGGRIDRRSDIYSLGVMLFQMLSGGFPFSAQSPRELLRRQNLEPPLSIRHHRPDVPEGIDQLLFRMLDKNPEIRPATAKEASAIFEHVLKAARGGAPTYADGKSPTLRESPASTQPEKGRQEQATAGGDQAAKTVLRGLPAPDILPDRVAPAGESAKARAVQGGISGSRNLRQYAIGAVLALLACVAFYYGVIHRPAPAVVVAPSPTPVQVTRIHLMDYSLEITTNNCDSLSRGTGDESLESGQSFRLHFTPRENGYLYLIAPGKEDVPTTYLTALADPESGVKTNFIESGSDFSIPRRADKCYGITDRGRIMAFTVIFSPTVLVSPAFLAAPAGRELNAAQQHELTNWLQQYASRATPPTPDAKLQLSRVTVAREAGAPARPVVFELLVKHR